MFNSLIPLTRSLQNSENFFDRFFKDDFFTNAVSPMKVDIKDTADAYLLEAEIPGIEKEKLNIDYQNNYLTISANQVDELNEEKENYIRRERHSQKMSRSFYIENISADRIDAEYKNGVLKITLPKDDVNAQKKTIQIK
ncbi:MAG: Hsp20/alpha crystallin family protein [Peptostreptococcales bacterium]